MVKFIMTATLITLLVLAMVLANAGNLTTTNETPEPYAAPTPSGITVTREPVRSYEPTEPAPSRTPSPFATDPAGG